MQGVRYLVLLVPYLGLAATGDLGSRLGVALACFGAALAAMVWARRWQPVPSARVVILVATAMRLLLLPIQPSLSDDIYRYVWDGKVAGAGLNPYELSPDAPELASLRGDIWLELDHRDVATVYPPLALTLFSIAARFPWPILAWKLIVTIADLIACYFLCRLAATRKCGRGGAIWYAWNPLAVVETAGMGHVDALGVCFVLVAVWALAVKRDSTTAALAAAAGILSKLVPLILVPAWMRQSPRPWVFAGLVGLTLIFAFGPVATSVGGIPSGYVRFGTSWEFNGPLYEPLWRGLDAIDSRDFVEDILDRRKERSEEHEYWNRFYPWNHPRMHARLLLAGLLGGLVIAAWRKPDPVTTGGRVLEATLLCSATVYPWYLLWLLPFAALEERRAWLVLCCSGILAYVPQFTQTPMMPWIFAALWGPYAAMRLLDMRRAQEE
ncbi:MAG: glycosyltransferase 87 family protein [Thermoanaerobaculia bacterium]